MINYMDEMVNKIHEGDAFNLLKKFPSGSVDLVLTSPPYYQQRDYGYSEGMIGNEKSPESYINNLMHIFNECVRVTRDTGSIVFNIGDKYDANGSLLLIPFRFAIAATEQNKINLINQIIWLKQNPQPRQFKRRLVSSHEPFLHFVKSKSYKYHIDEFDPEPTKIKHKTGSGNGNNIGHAYFELIEKSSLTEIEKTMAITELTKVINEIKEGKLSSFRMKIRGVHAAAYGGYEGGRKLQIEKNGFTIIRMFGNPLRKDVIITPKAHNRDSSHPAVFPEPVVEQIIKLTTDKNDIVLDPFVGSGTTAIVAKRLNRRYIGIDINGAYCDMARKRLKSLESKQSTIDKFAQKIDIITLK